MTLRAGTGFVRQPVQIGALLWIGDDIVLLPACPDGFPFRVDRLLNRQAPHGWVWVQGVQLDPASKAEVQQRELCVSLRQRRAVEDDTAGLVGPPPNFQRVI